MGRKRCIDLVLCIDGTSNMNGIVAIKDNLISMIRQLIDCFRINTETQVYDELTCYQFRVKVVLFRDFQCCSTPIEESMFYYLPDQLSELESYIDTIEFKGGYGWRNTLEAIAYALLNTEWADDCYLSKNIMVISNGKIRKLGENQTLLKQYLKNMPKDLDQFKSIAMVQRPLCRLICISPDDEQLTEVGESMGLFMHIRNLPQTEVDIANLANIISFADWGDV